MTGVLACLVGFATAATSPVEHQVCGLSQLSETQGQLAGGRPGAISPDGDRLLILSRQDLVGENRDGNMELFFIDIESNETIQLTRTSGFDPFPDGFSADRELARIAFRSNRSLQSGEQIKQKEIYLLDLEEGGIQTITSGAFNLKDPSPPVLSGDGKRIAMISESDPSGENLDQSNEVFLYDIDSSSFVQASQIFAASSLIRDIALSENGRFLAMLISHLNFSEIKVTDTETGQAVLSYTGSHFSNLSLSSDGKSIFFVSSASVEGQGQRDGSQEIFRLSWTSPGGPYSLHQLTDLPPLGNPLVENVSYSRDGRWIAFESRADLSRWKGNGARNLYLLNGESKAVDQVTYFSQPQLAGGGTVVSNGGNTLVFSNQGNPLGRNPDRNQEAFLARCEPAPVRFFPHIGSGVAGGRGIQTQFVFSNGGDDSSVLIEFYDSSGAPMNLSLVGEGTQSTFSFQLSRGTPLILQTYGFGPLAAGYARITTGPGVDGTAVFTGSIYPAQTIIHEASVPLTVPLEDFSIVVNTEGLFKTGLAMVSMNSDDYSTLEEDNEIHMRLYDQSGTFLASRKIELATGKHTAFFVDQAFSGIAGVTEMIGLLTVESEKPLADITLRQHDHPQIPFPVIVPTMTTLPVSPRRPDKSEPDS